MPEHRIDKPPVPLSTAAGESYISFTDVVVDERDHSTYVEASARIRHRAFNTVKVIQEVEGYDLIIFDKDTSFRPRDLKEVAGRLIPVVKITEQSIQPTQNGGEDLARQALQALDSPTTKDEPRSHTPPRAGAKMTPSRLQGEDPLLVNSAGEEFWIMALDIVVDQHGSTYIRSNARVVNHKSFMTARVKREADGYHLILRNSMDTAGLFTPRQIDDYSNLIPVAKVSEEDTMESAGQD